MMRIQTRLAAVLLLIWCCVTPALAKVFLVSVGIADYPGTESDLRISSNDAKTISAVFKAATDTKVTMLTNEKATREGVLSAMRTTYAQASDSDAVILFFSGHGAPGALCCYDGQLSYQRIFDVLKEFKAARKMILADACFSGKMRTSNKKVNQYHKQNAMLFLSSRTTETSWETAYRNSAFTMYLERGLRGGADTNKDRVITARELFTFVHKGVIKHTNDRQHPVMWGNFDDNMEIIKW